MLQDIAPHIFDNAYDNKRCAAAQDRILCFRRNEVLLQKAEDTASGYRFPTYDEAFAGRDGEEINQKLYYLFSIDKTGYFLAAGEDLSREIQESAQFQPMQVFRTMGEGDTVPLAMMTGFHIYTWMRKNQYCGCCGHEMKPHGVERALSCPGCHNLIFPQIAPAVAVAIINGDKILLARSVQSAPNRFSLIAGYVEVGETIEQTVHREVLEEVGLQVKNLQYYKSQPWGLTGIEMLGFFVELSGSDAVTIQESELAEARWFTAAEIDWEMAHHSLSYTMIDAFCRR